MTGDDPGDAPRADAACPFCATPRPPSRSSPNRRTRPEFRGRHVPWCIPRLFIGSKASQTAAAKAFTTACTRSAPMKCSSRIRTTTGICGSPATTRSAIFCAWRPSASSISNAIRASSTSACSRTMARTPARNSAIRLRRSRQPCLCRGGCFTNCAPDGNISSARNAACFCDIIQQEERQAQRVIEARGDYLAAVSVCSARSLRNLDHAAQSRRVVRAHQPEQARPAHEPGRAAATHAATHSNRYRGLSSSAAYVSQQHAPLAKSRILEDHRRRLSLAHRNPSGRGFQGESYTFKEIYYSPVSSETAVKQLREAKIDGMKTLYAGSVSVGELP